MSALNKRWEKVLDKQKGTEGAAKTRADEPMINTRKDWMFTFCCVFLLLLLLVTLARADSGRDRCEEMFVCAMAELFFSFYLFLSSPVQKVNARNDTDVPSRGFPQPEENTLRFFLPATVSSSVPYQTHKKSKVSSRFIIGPICAPRLSSSGGIEKSSRKERRNERYRY